MVVIGHPHRMPSSGWQFIFLSTTANGIRFARHRTFIQFKFHFSFSLIFIPIIIYRTRIALHPINSFYYLNNLDLILIFFNNHNNTIIVKFA